jgi:recombinational DNA repair protein RecR
MTAEQWGQSKTLFYQLPADQQEHYKNMSCLPGSISRLSGLHQKCKSCSDYLTSDRHECCELCKRKQAQSSTAIVTHSNQSVTATVHRKTFLSGGYLEHGDVTCLHASSFCQAGCSSDVDSSNRAMQYTYIILCFR